MRKTVLVGLLILFLSAASGAQFTFHLIDNFEDGTFNRDPKWWRFGDIKPEIVGNGRVEAKRDLISESCGDYSLRLTGKTNDWYIGGIGSDIGVDGSKFSRFQIDIFGHKDYKGKLKLEIFDDDNMNYSIEQNPQKGYEPVYDDKWVAEVNVQGRGFTRVSIPFTAFKDANPGIGDDIWNPNQENGSGGLMKMQMVIISEDQKGDIDCRIDNLLLTY